MEKVFETEKALLQYNKISNAIELIWKKQHDTDTYRMVFNKGLNAIQQFRATGWLSDIRKEGVVSPTNTEWLTNEIVPQALKFGLKRIAVVLEADIFKEFYLENIAKSTGREMMRYFDSKGKADEWLIEITGL